MAKYQQFIKIMILFQLKTKVKIWKMIIPITLHGLKVLEKIKRNIWVLLEKLKMLKVQVNLFRKIPLKNNKFSKKGILKNLSRFLASQNKIKIYKTVVTKFQEILK